jgi:hypothetical protein
MRLHELQLAMQERVLDRNLSDRAAASLLDLVDGQGLQPSQRLQIYRNNCLISLTEALKATYPVIHRLVGDGFFRTAAAAFIKASPPQEPRLSAYGAAFPTFLAQYAPAATLVYLPDMARLEWALNAAWHAPDAPALTAAQLSQASESGMPLHLHPACHLLESPWPIERIWHAHRTADEIEHGIHLDQGGCRLLVYRQGFDVTLATLSGGEFALLGRFADGADLESAVTDALAADPTLDVAAALAAILTRGSLTATAAG